jgi:hypothetical protein
MPGLDRRARMTPLGVMLLGNPGSGQVTPSHDLDCYGSVTQTIAKLCIPSRAEQDPRVHMRYHPDAYRVRTALTCHDRLRLLRLALP